MQVQRWPYALGIIAAGMLSMSGHSTTTAFRIHVFMGVRDVPKLAVVTSPELER